MAEIVIEDIRKFVELDLKNDGDLDTIEAVCEALGNRTRLNILRRMQAPPYIFTVPQLAKAMKMPVTTLMFHLEKLIKADVLTISYKASKKGAVRLISRKLKSVNISCFYTEAPPSGLQAETQTARVGQFCEFEGGRFNFCTADKHYTSFGDNCYLPERFDAELVYATSGRIAYRFSNQAAKLYNVRRIVLSLEICSEAPFFDNDYLSDITFWINGKEVLTYTSPGDFGDHIGRLNPEWWDALNTQYGVLLTIVIDDGGVTLNGEQIDTKLRLKDLDLKKGNKTEIGFGNKDTARNVGGFNIFGKKFGDYPQDINYTVYYEK